jgi:hypothetical protein
MNVSFDCNRISFKGDGDPLDAHNVKNISNFITRLLGYPNLDQLYFRELDFDIFNRLIIDDLLKKLFNIRVWKVVHIGGCQGAIPDVIGGIFHSERVSYVQPLNDMTQRSFFRELAKSLTSSDCTIEELAIEEQFDATDEPEAEAYLDGVRLHGEMAPSTSIKPLVEGLSQNKTLKLLDLEGSIFHDDDTITLLAHGMATNQTLVSLNLSNCTFSLMTAKPFRSLINALKLHPCLRHIYFSKLNVDNQVLSHTIADLIRDTKSITHLDLHNCDLIIREPFIHALSENTTLTSLVLTNNSVDETEATYLAQALRENSKLEWLDLRCNQLSNIGINTLTRAITQNPKSRIKELLLDGNGVSVRGCRAVLETMKSERCVLESVQLGLQNQWTDEIEFWNGLNRIGRQLLEKTGKEPAHKKRKVATTDRQTRQSKGGIVPLGLWSVILGRIRHQHYYQTRSWDKGEQWSPQTQAEIMYYMVRESNIAVGIPTNVWTKCNENMMEAICAHSMRREAI